MTSIKITPLSFAAIVGLCILLWGSWMILYGYYENNFFNTSPGDEVSIFEYTYSYWRYTKFELLKIIVGLLLISPSLSRLIYNSINKRRKAG